MLPNCDKSAARRRIYPSVCALVAAAAIDLDVEVADFLAKRVAIDPEQIGGADLVAARGRERRRKQRIFDFAQDAVVEPSRRQTVLEAGEIGGKVTLDGGTEPLFAGVSFF